MRLEITKKFSFGETIATGAILEQKEKWSRLAGRPGLGTDCSRKHVMTALHSCHEITNEIMSVRSVALALKGLLAGDRFSCNTVDKLSSLLARVSEEKVDLSVTAIGIGISKSLFVPFEIMDEDLRERVEILIQKGQPNYLDVLQNDERKFIMKYKTVDSDACKKVGLMDLLCGLFLCLQEVYGRDSLVGVAFFDEILQLALNDRQVPYATVVQALKQYGYVCSA